MIDPSWILLVVAAVVFYKAGNTEENRLGVYWCLLSLAVSAVAILLLHAGFLLCVIAQVILFVGIGVVRAWMEQRGK